MWETFLLVGTTRFELATPRPPDVCATGLRYVPNYTRLLLLVNIFCLPNAPSRRGGMRYRDAQRPEIHKTIIACNYFLLT